MYEKVLAAAERLKGVAHKTPVMTSGLLDERTGNTVFLKCENLQRIGAFKFRGAYNAVSLLPLDARRKGVITYSAGNHAQAVALASKLMNVPATVVMPSDAAAVKVEATKGYGANVVFYDRASEDRVTVTRQLMDQYGYTLIPPFDHEDVVAGQGTAVKELIEETGELDYLFVQCSGGGLLSGSAISSKHLQPKCKVIGVQPEGADYSVRAFKTGVVYHMKNAQTVADGLRGTNIGTINLPIVRSLVDDMITVSDDDIIHAMYFVWTRLKLVVEPAGVTGLAVLFQPNSPIKGKRIGVILSGGNVDVRQVGEIFKRVSD